jgi:hypothetical protein
MFWPYDENRCNRCPFAGTVSELEIEGVKRIECLRDNEDAKKHFNHMIEGQKRFDPMLEDECDLLQRQEVDLQYCIYDDRSGAQMAVSVQR